ncbi:hypothetical protein GF327_05870 [Candidatus Woesearchaeota archaeon]|nr:hypothetical protein [Candidatus Woesearchaeota archaeon]
MGKRSKKKPNQKKLKYAKFRKEKSGKKDIKMPDLSSDQEKQKRVDEEKMMRFFRYNRNPRRKEIIERRMVSKRDI